MRFYWFTSKRGFGVSYHLLRKWRSRWTKIRGVQVGDWFIGAVKGRCELPQDK